MRALFDRRPFVPFRVHMAGGETVDVSRPGPRVVTQDAVFLGVEVDERGIADRIACIHFASVAGIERLGE
jgi:hypothetical protein